MIVFCLLYNLCTSSGSGVSLRFSVVIGALATGLKSKTSDSVLADILALGGAIIDASPALSASSSSCRI